MFEEGVRALRRRSDREASPIAVPYASLAKALGGGLWPGLYVIAGPVASGKTQFALSLALHAAQERVETAVHTPAASPAETSARLLGLHSKRSWSAMYTGEASVDAAEVERLGALSMELTAAPSSRDKQLFVTDRLRGPVDRSSEQTLVAAVDGAFANASRAIAEAAPHELLDRVGIDPDLASVADAVLILVPVGAVEPNSWRSVRLGVAKLRHGVPTWIDLSFNGTWFEEEAPEFELSLA